MKADKSQRLPLPFVHPSKTNYSLSFALIQIHLWTMPYIKGIAEKHILL